MKKKRNHSRAMLERYAVSTYYLKIRLQEMLTCCDCADLESVSQVDSPLDSQPDSDSGS